MKTENGPMLLRQSLFFRHFKRSRNSWNISKAQLYLCMSRDCVCSQFPCCPHLSQRLMMIMIMGSKVNHGARFKVFRPPLHTEEINTESGKMENYSSVLVTNPTSCVKFIHVSRHEPPLITILVIETTTSSPKKTSSNMQLKVWTCAKSCVRFVYSSLHKRLNRLMNSNTWTFCWCHMSHLSYSFGSDWVCLEFCLRNSSLCKRPFILRDCKGISKLPLIQLIL